ncbi:MAG TPA: serine hydrolase [Gemmatimonadaceae bacterium]|nr:serine hydrolase [Gemmatimonadaceae bacterium]
MKRGLTVLLALVPACAPAQTPSGAPQPMSTSFARADTAALHRTLDGIASAHKGVVGYSVRNVDTGEQLELRGDEPFPTASLIKMSLLVTLFDLIEKGSISLSDPIRVLKVDKVPGSGMIQHLHDGIEITVGDAAYMMSTISDNTATNLLIDKVSIRRTWEKMEALGLPRTKLHSKSFLRATSVAMDSSVKYGLGVTTPNEMSQLFALLAQGKAVSPRADSTMLAMLADNTNGQLLQRLTAGVRLAHKDGATDQVRTNCGLFWLQSRVSVCVMTKENQDRRWVIDNEAQVTIARMGEAIVAAWPRLTTARQ